MKKDLLALEAKWRHHVLTSLGQPDIGKKKYVLAQFPYPSGLLHMGHARVYTMADTLARRYTLQGYSVRHPMGWDAFGLPAENAAKKHQIDPAAWTATNVQQMRQQMDSLGLAFDWKLQINTSSCTYHKWSQYLFKRLFKAGLAYKAEAPVNWDPIDQTVLAEEQVDAQGCSWRSGAKVEKKILSQWFIKTTHYADRLVDDLDKLTAWPDSVKQMQKDWIGRQFGFESVFYCKDASLKLFVCQPLDCIDKILVPHGHEFALRNIHQVKSDLNAELLIPIVVDQDTKSVTIVYKPDSSPVNPSTLTNLGYKVQKKYKLHDWLISRQRKWGTPIPISYCPTHGMALNDKCQSCNGVVHEQDTMDTFVDSSWYYMRFCDPNNDDCIFDPEAIRQWMPVDVYIGGVEHAVLHLLYARFMHKFIKDDQELDIPDEPFQRLICQGLVMGKTFKCPDTERYLKRDEYRLVQSSGTHVAILPDDRPAKITWEKMSKSKFNGVDPIGLVERFGADAVRLSVLFKAPPEFPLYWDERDLIGQHRWLLRLLQMYERWTDSQYHSDGLMSTNDKDLLLILNETIVQVSDDLSEQNAHFHTAIAALMKLSNRMADFKELHRSATFETALKCLAIMLYPMAPFCSSELYSMLYPNMNVGEAKWPTPIDLPCGAVKSVIFAVQLNGKTVDKIRLPMDCSQEHVHGIVMQSTRQMLPKDPQKIVFIPNRVINYCS